VSTVDGAETTGPMGPRSGEVLALQALDLIAGLHREPDCRQVTTELVQQVIEEETGAIASARGDAFGSGRWDDARALFTEMTLSDEYDDLLTVPACERTP